MKKIAVVFVLLVCSAVASAQSYTIQQYLNIRSASAPSFSPNGRSIAYLTNVTGTQQIWVTTASGGTPKQLTNYDDNIGFVRWLADGNILFGKAKGGDENTQFFVMKADGSGVRELTNEPKIRHNFAEVSNDGKTIYYASNKRNPTYFDVYGMDIVSGKETLLYQYDGNVNIATVNNAGTKFVLSRDSDEKSLDNDLYMVDVRTKKETHLTPHSDASEFGDVNFLADSLLLTTNDNREFQALVQIRKKNAAGDDWSEANRETSVIDGRSWDIGGIALTDNASMVAYTVNDDGYSQIYLRKIETDGKPLISVVDAKPLPAVQMPGKGIAGGVTFSRDGSKLAYSFSSPTRNSDIWVYDIATRERKQITNSDRAGIDQRSFVEPQLIKYRTFDGLEIPAWYYNSTAKTTPTAKSNEAPVTISYSTGKTPRRATFQYSEPYFPFAKGMPVIVSVHGGPEGQERPGFSGLYQYYLSRGYAILATNVRGSTGYGKTYTHLDDVKNREDSVKDLSYAVQWLKTSGGADPKRIAVMGGSYGGYMTLAAITLYPDLWAAAVDTVGISNWESFLKNTSGYRRRQREVEYGRLDRDIDFLRSISPIAKIDRIRAPLFVIAGRNDPRVPWTEGQQMVDALRKRGATVEWKVYDDEGHGVSKLKNRLELYPLVADFLDKYMK
jgi:dipeptidyl aminopeptidase/acylaminoacyl peptidase